MNWYNKLTKSEKTLLNYGAIVVAVALLWALVYQPITKSIKSKQKQHQELQKQYQQMQQSQQQLIQQNNTKNKYQRHNNKPFISWIDEQLENQQLAKFVTRSEPKDNKTLILTFANVAFDDLAKWLQILEQNYAINIPEADINLIDRENGLCNARLTLEE